MTNETAQEAIGARYADAGFTSVEAMCSSGLVFENAFSIQAVFVVRDFHDLSERWPRLHGELIDAYRSYQGFVDMEWNFYCIFVVADTKGADEFRTLSSTIENDTSYSRKFVLSADEIPLLPPGRFDRDVGILSSAEYADPAAQWRTTLGDDLFERICDATFANLEEVVAQIIRDEADRAN